MLKSIVYKYYGFQLFFSLLVWLPIFYEYQLRIGLSSAEIFSIQSIYYTAFCLLEIPTGLVADRFGYRRCMVWGAAVLVAANLVAIFLQNFAGLTVHFLLIALSRSLISGTSSAYLYDSLAQQGQTEKYKSIEGRARAYGLIAKVLAWIGVGHLLNYHLTLPYWATVVAATISVGYALALPPMSSGADTKSRPQLMLPNLLGAMRAIAASRLLSLVILQGVGLFVLARIVQVNLFQPILSAKSFDVTSFGWIMSLMTIFEAVGSFFPGALKNRMGHLEAVFLMTLVTATSLGLIPISPQTATLICLCVFSLAVGLSFPVQKQLMNDLIPSGGFRATVLSIESIVDRAACAIVAALLGTSVAGATGVSRVLLTSSIVTYLGTFALMAAVYLFTGAARERVAYQRAHAQGFASDSPRSSAQ